MLTQPSYRSLRNPTVAIVGATGAVGAELIRCLEERDFPAAGLRLLASARSAGRAMTFRGAPVEVQALGEDSFAGVDLALFAADADTARTYAPLARAAGAVVIDNSSAFRMDPDCPLVVPEVNLESLTWSRGVVANPNCTAIILCVAVAPLQRRFGLRRLQVATYQAASGAGAPAMQELLDSTRAFLDGRPFEPQVFRHPYAFNVFSHNDAVDPLTGYNGEESKVMAETRRILGAANLPVGVTCVRVPVLRAHALAVTAEFDAPVPPSAVRECLEEAAGVRVIDDREANHFPMPVEAQGQGDVLAGRIRRDLGDPSGRSVAMFLAGDQLLKGAALNAVQIAEQMLVA
ncbi:MAG: aspartate-semialdehyde dehydrogenase [Phenylobacterium sp.]|uniref:aspartate-semialdehyde dehydrogenase n=1 Tax=Phenylobacterium sp. TaxID=1871053 RepID=UPI0025F93287|nr:aspartate-semialdehyde dehydrogenase [Phenylobacterium sp.]MBI1200707.1 aspartate-semialdehyde dehydrogenase [Phenylobacterium sp.]